jgi:RNA methyltransferase, TrmH family
MLISSIDNKKIKEVRKLLDKKYSLEKGLFIIEGDHAVREAIKKNLLYELYLLEDNNDLYNFNYDTLTIKVMKSISDLKSTPRVIGVCKIKYNNNLGDKIVLLDDIQDPGNAGTIIRSCVAFGVDTVIFSKNSVSPYNSKVIRSTEGMIFNINIIINDLESILNEIKQNGIEVIGTSLNTSNSAKNIVKSDKYAVVFGNEGNGVSVKILSLCDKIYKINMKNYCESLNVGVSCGIILYKLFEG